MSLKDKLAVVIVVFNISNLIETQINLIKRFCKDDFDIIVIDNSSDLKVANDVKSIVNNLNCIYLKTSSPSDFSQSHATACNFAYKQLKHYKYMLFLDHDNFPVENFSVVETMKNKVIGGVGQARKDIYYYWPGCVMINNELIDTNLVDFSVNNKLGLDTGGNLYKIIEKFGNDKCVNFDQYDMPNTVDPTQFFYNLICSPKSLLTKFSFMHFINASNWNNKERNNERLESLLQILKERTK